MKNKKSKSVKKVTKKEMENIKGGLKAFNEVFSAKLLQTDDNFPSDIMIMYKDNNKSN